VPQATQKPRRSQVSLVDSHDNDYVISFTKDELLDGLADKLGISLSVNELFKGSLIL
jgi:hypothetical protein